MEMVITKNKKPLNVTLEGVEGWVKPEEAQLLWQFARGSSEAIVEIGCYRGRSTIALALGAYEAKGSDALVYSVDPHARARGVMGGEFTPYDRTAYYQNLLKADLSAHAALINLPSEKVALVWDTPIGVLFIDGDHRYEAVKKDITLWSPHLVAGGIAIFDDATKEGLGPDMVIKELLKNNHFETIKSVGKMHALRKIIN